MRSSHPVLDHSCRNGLLLLTPSPGDRASSLLPHLLLTEVSTGPEAWGQGSGGWGWGTSPHSGGALSEPESTLQMVRLWVLTSFEDRTFLKSRRKDVFVFPWSLS